MDDCIRLMIRFFDSFSFSARLEKRLRPLHFEFWVWRSLYLAAREASSAEPSHPCDERCDIRHDSLIPAPLVPKTLFENPTGFDNNSRPRRIRHHY
jgi:hypothetical protein